VRSASTVSDTMLEMLAVATRRELERPVRLAAVGPASFVARSTPSGLTAIPRCAGSIRSQFFALGPDSAAHAHGTKVRAQFLWAVRDGRHENRSPSRCVDSGASGFSGVA
jgi:hypothetical protein